MKLKIIILVISLIGINFLIISCNKEPVQNKKMITQWVIPTDNECISNGGKIFEGVCQVNWGNARGVCSAIGSRLPNIDELKKVIVDCGGELNNFKKNQVNSNYQSCYKKQGFSNYDLYWSSNSNSSNMSQAWFGSFFSGSANFSHKSTDNYVRCVKIK